MALRRWCAEREIPDYWNGKQDIIAYMENPFKVDNEIGDLEVGLTVVDGRIRYIR